MDPRKDNAFSKGKGKVSERADNGGKEEVLPLFYMVRHFPEGLPSHISHGFDRVKFFDFKDSFLSALQWPELMAFLASVSMIGILNMASCHVNFPLLEALAKRFNYQTDTFFLPTGETTPTLEEIVRVSGLSFARIAYQPSTTTDDHSIMGARKLGAAYSSHEGYTIFPAVMVGIYRGLHDRVTRGDRFIEGSILILQVYCQIQFYFIFAPGTHSIFLPFLPLEPNFCHKISLEPARTNPGVFGVGDIGGVAHTSWSTSIWAYERIAIVYPPQSTTTVSTALGLAYVNESTRPRDVNYYRWVLDEFSSFDWVIRGLDNVPMFFPPMGYSCLNQAGQYFTEGYFQGKPTTTSNYNSWWDRSSPLPLCPKFLRLHDERSTPARNLVSSRENDASSSNKWVKSDVSDISLEDAELKLARWAAFVVELKEKDVDPKSKTE
ncbi:hypothetical protein AMTRI_Chr02g216720 [Amborella trichopoda]